MCKSLKFDFYISVTAKHPRNTILPWINSACVHSGGSTCSMVRMKKSSIFNSYLDNKGKIRTLGTPLQYSCLENPMDGGVWWAAVHGVAKSPTRLSDFTFTFSLSCIGEGNGNPLQCSCLENPRDGEAWWAAVYGVAQSQTRLKRLSSSRIVKVWIKKKKDQIFHEHHLYEHHW